MENREFYIDKDGFKIYAKLDFPEKQKDKMPLVILVHGLTGHTEQPHIIATKDAAVEAGYVCLRIDMYGHGKTDGKFCNHHVGEWLNELLYVIDYARELDFVSEIYLAGHSQGGLTLMLAAGMKADQIKGIIPMAPAIVIPDMCKKGSFFGYDFDENTIPDKIIFPEGDKYVTSNYIRVARTLHVDEAIEAFHGPVLIVHSTTDEGVPVSYAIDAQKKYENCELALIPDDNHCYDRHLDMAADAVKQWLLKQN